MGIYDGICDFSMDAHLLYSPHCFFDLVGIAS